MAGWVGWRAASFADVGKRESTKRAGWEGGAETGGRTDETEEALEDRLTIEVG